MFVYLNKYKTRVSIMLTRVEREYTWLTNQSLALIVFPLMHIR